MNNLAKWRWQPFKGSWRFEAAKDRGTLFYPRGWGRGYLVPTKEKRSEIEEYLTQRLDSLGFIVSATRWLMLGWLAILVLALAPTWLIFGKDALIYAAVFYVVAAAPACLIISASQTALWLAAETARTDLDKSDWRRSFASSLTEWAEQRSWSSLWIEEAIWICSIFYGARMIWPYAESVVVPAQRIPYALPIGLMQIVFGVLFAPIWLWQMKAKLESGRASAQ